MEDGENDRETGGGLATSPLSSREFFTGCEIPPMWRAVRSGGLEKRMVFLGLEVNGSDIRDQWAWGRKLNEALHINDEKVCQTEREGQAAREEQMSGAAWVFLPAGTVSSGRQV